MFTTQLHGDNVTDDIVGSLTCRIGHRIGVDCLDELERYLQYSATDDRWNRGYVIRDGHSVIAVWRRSPAATPSLPVAYALCHIARTPDYSGTWKPEFVNPAVTQVITGQFGMDADSFSAAGVWATHQLTEGVATAVMLNKGGVYAAWELNARGVPQLVARSL